MELINRKHNLAGFSVGKKGCPKKNSHTFGLDFAKIPGWQSNLGAKESLGAAAAQPHF